VTIKPTLAIDKTIALTIHGSQQRVRLCAARAELPPLLVVQHGPGFPVLHEVAKFQRHLHLEEKALVAYWEQRGCGNVSADAAQRTSLSQQVDDLHAVLQWFANETRQRVLVFGISIGATISLLAAARASDCVKAVIAISPDLQTRAADAAVDAFLREQVSRAGSPRLQRALTKMGPPPYLDPRAFQRRATLLADFGTIERGKSFSGALRDALLAMIRGYGLAGTIRALRNMNIVQRRILPDMATVDLFVNPPQVRVPVHYVFGEHDALTAAFTGIDLPAVIGGPGTTVVRLRNAGHLVHFDQPAAVRSIAEQAREDPRDPQGVPVASWLDDLLVDERRGYSATQARASGSALRTK